MEDIEEIFEKLTSQKYLEELLRDATDKRGEGIWLEDYLKVRRTLFMGEMQPNLQVFSEADEILQTLPEASIFQQVVTAGKDILAEYVDGREELFYEKEVELLLISYTIAYFTDRIKVSNPAQLFKAEMAIKEVR